MRRRPSLQRPVPFVDLALLCMAVVTSMTVPARALHGDESGRTAPAPRYRIELMGPLVGLGGFFAPSAGYDRQIYVAATELRVLDRSGHGAQLRLAVGSTFWGNGVVAEPAYVRRVRLDGDDRLGLAIDLSVGPTLAVLRHDESTVPAGDAIGGHLGVALTAQVYGLSLSLEAQYRGFVPLRAPEIGSAGLEHAVTAMFGLGVGFWG